MTSRADDSPNISQPEPRWPAAVAVLATAGLYLSLPESLTLGPNWLLLIVFCVLLVATITAHQLGNAKLNFRLGVLLSAVMTAAVIWSLVDY